MTDPAPAAVRPFESAAWLNTRNVAAAPSLLSQSGKNIGFSPVT
jgi:hypothetical protein